MLKCKCYNDKILNYTRSYFANQAKDTTLGAGGLGSLTEPVKSDTMSRTARHCCDVSSQLYWYCLGTRHLFRRSTASIDLIHYKDLILHYCRCIYCTKPPCSTISLFSGCPVENLPRSNLVQRRTVQHVVQQNGRFRQSFRPIDCGSVGWRSDQTLWPSGMLYYQDFR